MEEKVQTVQRSGGNRDGKILCLPSDVQRWRDFIRLVENEVQTLKVITRKYTLYEIAPHLAYCEETLEALHEAISEVCDPPFEAREEP